MQRFCPLMPCHLFVLRQRLIPLLEGLRLGFHMIIVDDAYGSCSLIIYRTHSANAAQVATS